MRTETHLRCVGLIPKIISQLILCLIIVLSISSTSNAAPQRDLYLWAENFHSNANIALLELALEKARPRYGNIVLKPTVNANYDEAFKHLKQNKNGFDLMISGLNQNREKNLMPVYFPLDRGLLGFRICIISKYAKDNFAKVSSNLDFRNLSLQVALDSSWPDASIMQANQIPITSAKSHEARLNLVRNSDTTCYSRSILEIENEIALAPSLNVENSFVMIYPQADILYFRKGTKDIAEAVEYGLLQAFQDGSFYTEFENQYREVKVRYSLYERKLLIMPSPILTEKGREAVNRYGLFSFIKQPTT